MEKKTRNIDASTFLSSSVAQQLNALIAIFKLF